MIDVGSFSKTLLPSLRLGYLVAPPEPSGRSAGREIGERPTRSQPYQMALAEFMSDGSFAGFLRRMRRIYAERHALLSDELLRIAPDLLRPILSLSGLHLATLLTEDIEESEMRERALAADVGVYPLSRLGMSARPKGLLFGFGNIPLTLIRDGLARLTAVFADHNIVRTIRRTGKTSSLQPFMDDPPRGRLAWRTSRRAPSRISRMGRERKHGDRSLRIAGADSMTVATLTASRRAVSLS